MVVFKVKLGVLMNIAEVLKKEGLNFLFENLLRTNTFGKSENFLSEIESALKTFVRNSTYLNTHDFPIAEGEDGFVVSLIDDNPDDPALYLVSDKPGIKSLPHTHDTWVVIVGIRGIEENILYTVIDGSKKIEFERRSVGPDMTISLMPSDIHSTQTTSEVPTLHLHIYGRPLYSLRPFAERTFFRAK